MRWHREQLKGGNMDPEKTLENQPAEEELLGQEFDPLEFNEDDEESLKEVKKELGEDPEDPETTKGEDPEKEKPAAKLPKSDHVPLSKYMEEKKRRQEAEKIISQQEAEREKYRLTNEYIERGYPEAEAKQLASKDVSQKQELSELKERQWDYDIKDLAKSDVFFADAEAFKDEIKGKMRDLKIGAEEAYMLLRGRSRTLEMKTEIEQSNLAKRQKAEGKKTVNASPSAPKNPYALDADDQKALARLRRIDPEGKWTAEKYHKLMKT
jgi:hypothetical protein